jgi:hypothetical protein
VSSLTLSERSKPFLFEIRVKESCENDRSILPALIMAFQGFSLGPPRCDVQISPASSDELQKFSQATVATLKDDGTHVYGVSIPLKGIF